MRVIEPLKIQLWLSFFLSLLTSTNGAAETDLAWVLEGDLSKISFEEEKFGGNASHVGLTFALVINSYYEVGFTANNSLIFSPSLKKGSNQLNDDDLITSASMFFVQRNWFFTDHVTGFALLGYADLEVETEDIQSGCIFVINCPTTVTTTYQNKDSGLAWGLGLRHKTGDDYFLSLKYVNYADGDFELSGWHIGFGKNTGFD